MSYVEFSIPLNRLNHSSLSSEYRELIEYCFNIRRHEIPDNCKRDNESRLYIRCSFEQFSKFIIYREPVYNLQNNLRELNAEIIQCGSPCSQIDVRSR